MSWDQYLDSLVMHSKDSSGKENIDRGAIIGLDGGAKWTTDTHPKALKISGVEAANIAKAMKSKNFGTFQSAGVRIGETKYQFLREEDNKIVYAKKKDLGALTIQSSKTAIVIGHTFEGGQQGTGNKAVGSIVEYLESQGF